MMEDPDLDGAYALTTPEDNLALYKTWARTYDADFVEASGFRFPRLVAEAIVHAGVDGPVLDVGCGTGAVAEHMPEDIVIDGLDLSPAMLAVARGKGRYRRLIEANLKEPLPLPDASYSGMVSSGTFTHGHVGGEALTELVRVLAPGALAAVSIRDEIWDSMGFGAALTDLADRALISLPKRQAERIYASADTAPDGHAEDLAFLTTFQRL